MSLGAWLLNYGNVLRDDRSLALRAFWSRLSHGQSARLSRDQRERLLLGVRSLPA